MLPAPLVSQSWGSSNALGDSDLGVIPLSAQFLGKLRVESSQPAGIPGQGLWFTKGGGREAGGLTLF